MAQFCAKFGKTMPCRGGQDWASKFANNNNGTGNKGTWSASLTILCDWYSPKFKNISKAFLKNQAFLKKKSLSLRGDYIGMFISQIWGFVVLLPLKNLPTRNKKIYCMYWSFLESSLKWFWCRSYELAIFLELVFNVLHSQNVGMST